jgi:chromosomal replication initiation ATPase DnaA
LGDATQEVNYLREYELNHRTPNKVLSVSAMDKIASVIADEFETTIDNLRAKGRQDSDAIGAYMVFCYLTHKLTGASRQHIATYTGRIAHSSVENSINTIRKRIQRDPDYAQSLINLQMKILEQTESYAVHN